MTQHYETELAMMKREEELNNSHSLMPVSSSNTLDYKAEASDSYFREKAEEEQKRVLSKYQ